MNLHGSLQHHAARSTVLGAGVLLMLAPLVAGCGGGTQWTAQKCAEAWNARSTAPQDSDLRRLWSTTATLEPASRASGPMALVTAPKGNGCVVYLDDEASSQLDVYGFNGNGRYQFVEPHAWQDLTMTHNYNLLRDLTLG